MSTQLEVTAVEPILEESEIVHIVLCVYLEGDYHPALCGLDCSGHRVELEAREACVVCVDLTHGIPCYGDGNCAECIATGRTMG